MNQLTEHSWEGGSDIINVTNFTQSQFEVKNLLRQKVRNFFLQTLKLQQISYTIALNYHTIALFIW